MSFLQSKFPIVCAVMNGVSDINLALAVDRAGATASLMVWIKDKQGQKNYDLLIRALEQFRDQTGHCNLVLGLTFEDLLDPVLIRLVCEYHVGYVEFLHDRVDPILILDEVRANVMMHQLRKTTKILCRCFDNVSAAWWVDAFCAKGSDSAGFGGTRSVREMFHLQKQHTPSTAVIPYGGIGTPEQVRYYMDQGAAAVAVGTLLAASQESCMSTATKMIMVRSSSDQLHRFADTGQNALILGSMQEILDDNGHWNRLQSLKQGIMGDGRQGMIYAGPSLDHVHDILPVSKIISHLARDLLKVEV